MKQLIGYLITISILLSQDILTTKAGNVYEGNLISYTTGDVDFISKGVHHSLPTSMVQRLVLEDGTVLIREGKQLGLVGSTITAGVILVNIVYCFCTAAENTSIQTNYLIHDNKFMIILLGSIYLT